MQLYHSGWGGILDFAALVVRGIKQGGHLKGPGVFVYRPPAYVRGQYSATWQKGYWLNCGSVIMKITL